VRHKNNFQADGVWLGCQQNKHIKVGEENMTKVAVVTGGSRGIGAAISIALRDAGYAVAANYGGNDEAAAAFSAETGIASPTWHRKNNSPLIENGSGPDAAKENIRTKQSGEKSGIPAN
jgi:hypothetical protein